MAPLDIIFQNLNKFYFEGERVRVKLEISLDKATIVNYIMANFLGMSSCLHDVGKQSEMSSKFFTKSQAEIYFDEVLPLFVAENNEGSSWLPGLQVFMLDFQLPPLLPSSLESEFGFIRYSVHVVADLNGEMQKKTEHFTVVSKTDLGKYHSLNFPGVIWKPETQCFLQALVCKAASIRAFVHIPKTGYVPGESLLINAELSNFHTYPVEWVKATLVQVLKHNGSKAHKVRAVTEITRGCVLPSETQMWKSESLLIPALPPSTYPPKKLINVKYRLYFQYKPSWQRKPLQLKLKVIIGAVGMVDCGPGEEQGQGEGIRIYNSEYFNGSNLEPCVFGPHFIKENGKSSTFSPLYPTYIVAKPHL